MHNANVCACTQHRRISAEKIARWLTLDRCFLIFLLITVLVLLFSFLYFFDFFETYRRFRLNYWKSTSTNQRVNSGANCSHQSHESLGSDLGSFVASRKAALSQIGLANTTRGAANRKESWIEEAHLNWLGMICSWLETLDTAVSEVYATMRNIANAFWMVKSRKE